MCVYKYLAAYRTTGWLENSVTVYKSFIQHFTSFTLFLAFIYMVWRWPKHLKNKHINYSHYICNSSIKMHCLKKEKLLNSRFNWLKAFYFFCDGTSINNFLFVKFWSCVTDTSWRTSGVCPGLVGEVLQGLGDLDDNLYGDCRGDFLTGDLKQSRHTAWYMSTPPMSSTCWTREKVSIQCGYVQGCWMNTNNTSHAFCWMFQ